VLAVIAAWHAADDPESASAIPRTRSKTRPGPLEEVAGKPMVFHAWHAAHAAKCVTRCVVATDDDAVETTALAFGARVVRVDDTKTKTKNEKNRNRFFGSVAGAARALAASNAAAFDVVAVVDADEAFVEAHHIERVADAVINGEVQSATCTRDVVDAAEARNDAGRVLVRAENGASAASGYATVASVFVAGTDADRHGALADETSVFVGVEVGVRSYLTSALLEIIDGAPPRTNAPEGSERSERRGFRNDADLMRNDPTREALRLGWRVAAVRAEARNRLGGLKTQRSLDARNAEIAAGEIRFVPLFWVWRSIDEA
jgi:GTP:adenosylcobinamide-phosphate guanylyltransferase